MSHFAGLQRVVEGERMAGGVAVQDDAALQASGAAELAHEQGDGFAFDDRVRRRTVFRAHETGAHTVHGEGIPLCVLRLSGACGEQQGQRVNQAHAQPVMNRRYPPDTSAAMSTSKAGTHKPRG